MAVPTEHEIYARWLDRGVRTSLALLVAAFLTYAFGLLEPLVPLERLTVLWTLPLERYLALTGAPTGWSWLALLDKGDALSLAGVMLLALVTLVCYLRLAVTLVQQGDRLLGAIALAQVVVLIAAASGWFAGGH